VRAATGEAPAMARVLDEVGQPGEIVDGEQVR